MHFRGFHTVDIFDCPPFQMFTNGDDPVSVAILESKKFEPHSIRLWCRLAKDASAILDVGAHVGVFSLAAASLRKDIQIHAFEPNPFTAARLRVNKHLNGFEHIVEHNVALAEAHGVAYMTWITKPNGWLSSGSSVSPGCKDGWQRAPVDVKTLDSHGIEPGANPLIKIDVEGTEHNVFSGMSEFLKSRPTIILESFGQGNCDFIAAKLPNYRFFLIDEAGHLEEQPTIAAAQLWDQNKNRLLVPKEREASLAP
jgi:FkbM family methyltransferase